MNANQAGVLRPLLACAIILSLVPCLAAGAEPAELARSISLEPGIRPGLWVHLGIDDGALTTALSMDGRNTVHGLSDDPERVARVRERIILQCRYGKVSIDACDWRSLPYSSGIV